MRLLFSIVLGLFYCSVQATDLTQKLQLVHDSLPDSKVFVHTDRTLYQKGETVYFALYFVNGNTGKAMEHKVELVVLNGQDQVVYTGNFLSETGKTYGSLPLYNVPGGLYKIKAWTNVSGNQGKEAVFTKTISILENKGQKILMQLEPDRKSYLPGQTVKAWFRGRTVYGTPLAEQEIEYQLLYKGIPKLNGTAKTDAMGNADIRFTISEDLTENDLFLSVSAENSGRKETVGRPIVLQSNEIHISFFPESGYLLNGFPARVAFKALLPNGKPADVKGGVYDQHGKWICEVSAMHDGMGIFSFVPENGMTYYFQPDGTAQKTSLPTALQQGISLQVEQNQDHLVTCKIYATSPENLILIARSHDVLQHEQKISLQQGENTFQFSAEKFPKGICAISLLDPDYKAVKSERRIFLHRNKNLSIHIHPEKSEFVAGEKIKLGFTFRNSSGNPVKSNFSVSVADEGNILEANDKQDHLLSYYYMTSELKGHIEEPSYYFDTTKSDSEKALDLLMLTHAWRRYPLQHLLQQTSPEILSSNSYKPLKNICRATLTYSGTKKNPFQGLKVSYVYKGKKYSCTADSLGQIYLPLHFDEGDQIKLMIRKGAFSQEFYLYKHYHLQYVNNGKSFAPLAELPVNRALSVSPKDWNNPNEIQKVDVAEVNGLSINSQEIEVNLSVDKMVVAGTYDMVSASSIQLLEVVSVAGSVGYSWDWSYGAEGESFGMGYNYSYPDYYPYYYDRENRYYPKYFGYQQGLGQGPGNQIAPPHESLLYWNGDVSTDDKGKAELLFTSLSKNARWKVVIMGFTEQGEPFMAEESFSTIKPISIETNFPAIASKGDQIELDVLVNNATEIPFSGKLVFRYATDGIYVFDTLNIDVQAKGFAHHFKAIPASQIGVQSTSVNLLNQQNHSEDFLEGKTEVMESGFTNEAFFASELPQSKFKFQIEDPIDLSRISSELTLILDPYSDLQESVQTMIREPYGCFEQVTSTNFPNILAVSYLDKLGTPRPEDRHRFMSYLQIGYDKLAKYITKENGFSLYGASPANEMYTAVGIMQFYQMKKIGVDVNENHIRNAVKWLLSRRDGKGGFLREGGTYGHAGAPEDVANAYITYVLASTGNADVSQELMNVKKDVDAKFDFYKMAIYANTLMELGKRDEALVYIDKLVNHLNAKGAQSITTGNTITRSYGNSANLEALAFLCIAIGENNLIQYKVPLQIMVEFINANRKGAYFGNTQTTVQCLRALMAALPMLRNKEQLAGSGKMIVNDEEFPFSYDHSNKRGNFKFSRFRKALQKGWNEIRVMFDNGIAPPVYHFTGNWKSIVPQNKTKPVTGLQIEFADQDIHLGEMVQMNIQVSNTEKEACGQTVAIIGIPGGMFPDPVELKRLSEEKLVDYFETRPGFVVFYWAEMGPKEMKKIPLRMKAYVAGTYLCPVSSAYRYYGAENKTWKSAGNITIQH